MCQRCLLFVHEGEVKNWGNFEQGSDLDLEKIRNGLPLESECSAPTQDETLDSLPQLTVQPVAFADIEALAIDKIRSIPLHITSQFGCKVEYNVDGDVVEHYYPITENSNVISYKIRDVASKEFSVVKATKGREVDLFGMLAHSKKKGMHVVITEGELDAMAAQTMLGKSIVDVMCLSLPFGANAKAISDNIDFLNKQDSVTIAFDQDEKGYEATEATWKILPDVKVMTFSEKDADDMLTKMKTAEFINAYTNAGKFKPKTVASIDTMNPSIVMAPVQMGLSYPWDDLTDMTYGMHPNQVVGIGAAPGAGKTTLVRGIQQHLMFKHGEKIGIFSLEEKAEWTTRLLVGYIMNKPIHIPGTIYNQKKAEAIMAALKDKAYFYEHKYYTGEWMEIENMIRYLHSIGVRFFFIDPLSSLVSHLTPSEANKYLSEAMYKLSVLVQQLDITVFHVNHLNTAGDGKSHEAGARIFASQFTGSRAQWRYSHGLIGAERNLLADDGSANVMTLRFLKDRAFGNTGKTCQLEYKSGTGRLHNIKPTFRGK